MSIVRTSVCLLVACLVGLVVSGYDVAAMDGIRGEGTQPLVLLSTLARHENAARADTAGQSQREDHAGIDQSISVTIEPGPLTIMRVPKAFVLRRLPGTTMFRGSLQGIRVVDARGTNSGWRLGARVSEMGERSVATVSAPLEVRVERVVAFARSTAGIRVPSRVELAEEHESSLLSARSGTGSGSFDVTLRLTLRATRIQGDQIAGRLAFRVS